MIRSRASLKIKPSHPAGSSEVKSPTKTSTATSTKAFTAGNVTVTGGAGDGATTVHIHKYPGEQDDPNKSPAAPKAKKWGG